MREISDVFKYLAELSIEQAITSIFIKGLNIGEGKGILVALIVKDSFKEQSEERRNEILMKCLINMMKRKMSA